MDTSILTTNPSFAVLRNREHDMLFSLYGEVKLLKGPMGMINAILADLSCGKTQAELVGRVAGEYSPDAADKVLDHLIRTGILIASPVPHPADETPGTAERHFVCLGDGPLARAVAAGKDNRIKRLSFTNVTRFPISDAADREMPLMAWIARYEEQLKELDTSVLAVCPENLDWLQLSALNRACLNLKLPWVLGYFTGSFLVLGPTVVPEKTPCLECLLEHRLRVMPPHYGVIREDMLQCVENFAVPEDGTWADVLEWSGWMLATELERLAGGREAPLYLKRQIHVPLRDKTTLNGVAFEPITLCPACQGMHRGRIATTPPLTLPDPDRVEIPLVQSTVRHNHSGLRALSTEDARALLDGALSRIKANVQIERMQGGLLDDVIPSFRSHISTVYSHDLPFIVYERLHWGKGMNEKQAYLSAGFELMERICAEQGKTEIFQCRYTNVKKFAIDLSVRVGRQYYLRHVDEVRDDTLTDWVWGWSLRHTKPVLIPASMVFHSKTVFQGKFILNYSSGLAAGTTLEDAVLQGLLETVEHDARYTWQANPVRLPILRGLPREIQDIKEQLVKRGCELVVRDYRTDLGIYVFRAWIIQPGNPVHYAVSGLGASLKPEIALFRAVTEAKQGWPTEKSRAEPHYASKSNVDLFGYNAPSLFMRYRDLQTDLAPGGKEVDYASLPDLSSGSISQDIHQVMDRIIENVPEADIIAFNLTREEFGIPVVRVIASGLQNPSQPLMNFPGNRLFKQPVTLGYSNRKLSFKEIVNDAHQE